MEKFRVEAEIVHALYDYQPAEDGRLHFNTGDVIVVLKKMDNGWWDGIVRLQRGWFPSNFVTSSETVMLPPMKSYGWVVRKTRDNLRIYHNTLTGETLTVLEDGTLEFDDHNNDSLVPDIAPKPVGNGRGEQSLPENWGTKSTIGGKVYYYNMLTNETTWSLDDIDKATGQLRVAENQKAASEIESSSEGWIDQVDTTSFNVWDRFYLDISAEISELRHMSTKEKARYLEQTSSIVIAVQQMFNRSSTLDKDSPMLKSNRMLGIHHRHILKALSKLVLTAKQAVGVWPPPDAVSIMKSDATEVLLAIRHFTNAAKELNVPVSDEVSVELPASSNNAEDAAGKTSGDGDRQVERKAPPSYVHHEVSPQALLSGIDACPELITAAIVRLHDWLNGRNDVGNGADLIALTGTIVTEVGQFLSFIEDVDTVGIPEDVGDEFERYKEHLYNVIRSLVTSTTTAVGPLPTVNALEQILYYSSSLESAVSDLVISAKYVLEERDSSRSYAGIDDEAGRETSLSMEPRRALSMGQMKNKQNLNLSESHSSGFSEDMPNRVHPAVTQLSIDERLVKSTPVSPMNSKEDLTHDNSQIQRKASVRKYKPRKVAASAPIPQRVTLSRNKSDKLSKFFGNDMPIADALEEDNNEWFLGAEHDPKDLLLSMEGQVKGATLKALTERMTAHDAYDSNLTQAFLLTYRSITNSQEVFELLERRFHITPPTELTDTEHQVWMEKKQKPVRLRVFNVLKLWLDSYFLSEDVNMLPKIRRFALEDVKDVMPLASDHLLKLVERRSADPSSAGVRKVKSPITSNTPNPVLPRNLKRFKMMDIDPLEMARQVTLIESRLYNSIRPVECLGKAWSDKENNRAPNISSMIELTNHITGWVAESILLEKDIKKRCAIMKYFIVVGDKCKSLKNFNALMAILAALNSSPIHRLKRTKELLSTKTRAILEELKRVMAPGQNFSNYRSELRLVGSSECVPFLGMYLTDLTFIEDGNGNFVKTMPHLINFDKRQKTAEKIREIQQYQRPYNLVEVTEIQSYLMSAINGATKDADQLYQKSLQMEPKEREDEKIARLLHESGFL